MTEGVRLNTPSLLSVAKSARKWGYDLYLLGRRNMVLLSGLYPLKWEGGIGEWTTCGWCNFALVRSTPFLRRIPVRGGTVQSEGAFPVPQ
eukprot:6413878-Prymnesium_polylepis.1